MPYDPTTHMMTDEAVEPTGSREIIPDKNELKKADSKIEREEVSDPAAAKQKVAKRADEPSVSPKLAPNLSQTGFKIKDQVRRLPGENGERHKAFVESARQHLAPESLAAQFLFADMTYAHRQVERYCALKQQAEIAALKRLFFKTIMSRDAKVADKPRIRFWKDGEPTELGLELLAKAGTTFMQLKARAFVHNLQSIGTMDALAENFRALRYNAAQILEAEKADRQANPPMLAVPFSVKEDPK